MLTILISLQRTQEEINHFSFGIWNVWLPFKFLLAERCGRQYISAENIFGLVILFGYLLPPAFFSIFGYTIFKAECHGFLNSLIKSVMSNRCSWVAKWPGICSGIPKSPHLLFVAFFRRCSSTLQKLLWSFNDKHLFIVQLIYISHPKKVISLTLNCHIPNFPLS